MKKHLISLTALQLFALLIVSPDIALSMEKEEFPARSWQKIIESKLDNLKEKIKDLPHSDVLNITKPRHKQVISLNASNPKAVGQGNHLFNDLAGVYTKLDELVERYKDWFANGEEVGAVFKSLSEAAEKKREIEKDGKKLTTDSMLYAGESPQSSYIDPFGKMSHELLFVCEYYLRLKATRSEVNQITQEEVDQIFLLVLDEVWNKPELYDIDVYKCMTEGKNFKKEKAENKLNTEEIEFLKKEVKEINRFYTVEFKANVFKNLSSLRLATTD